MSVDKSVLEKFRDLRISRAELYNLVPEDKRKLPLDKPVEICNSHVIRLLEGYRNGSESKESVLEWVNTVWFSGWFEYCDENCDSIASVLNELEEIDEDGRGLTNENVERYLHALRQNIVV